MVKMPYIVVSLARVSWALFPLITLLADSQVVICCLKMEGWLLKGGWLLLKSDNPLQSPNINGFNNHYIVH